MDDGTHLWTIGHWLTLTFIVIGLPLILMVANSRYTKNLQIKKEKHAVGTQILWTRMHGYTDIKNGEWESEIEEYSPNGNHVKLDGEWFETWKIRVLSKL